MFFLLEIVVRVNPVWFIRNNDILKYCNTSKRLKATQVKFPYYFEYAEKYYVNEDLSFHFKPDVMLEPSAVN